MNDIVKRLRRHGGHNVAPELLIQAADEIERLRVWSSDSHVTELEAEIERLRAKDSTCFLAMDNLYCACCDERMSP